MRHINNLYLWFCMNWEIIGVLRFRVVLIQIGLFAHLNLHDQPGLAALLQDNETIDDLKKLSPEQILLRWVNYHLTQSGCDRRVTNLTNDIKDSVIYIHLINQIAPADLGLTVNTDALYVSMLREQ